jgi:hypothetical protein
MGVCLLLLRLLRHAVLPPWLRLLPAASRRGREGSA